MITKRERTTRRRDPACLVFPTFTTTVFISEPSCLSVKRQAWQGLSETKAHSQRFPLTPLCFGRVPRAAENRGLGAAGSCGSGVSKEHALHLRSSKQASGSGQQRFPSFPYATFPQPEPSLHPEPTQAPGVNNLRGVEDPPEVSQEVNTELTATWPHRTHPLSPLTWTGMLGPPGGEMRRGPRERNSDARRLGRSSPGNVITLSVEGIYSQVLHWGQSPSNPLLTR